MARLRSSLYQAVQRYGAGHDLHTIANVLYAFVYHLLTRFQSRFYNVEMRKTALGYKAFHFNLVGAVHHVHIILVLNFKYGFLRHHQGIIYRSAQQHLAGSAVFQQVIGIGKFGPERNGASAFFKLAGRGFNEAGLVVSGIVGQNQFNRIAAVVFIKLSGFEVTEVLVFRNIEISINGADVGDRSQERAFFQ